jgi:predicted MFS family arabinose efflux permease
MTEKFSKNQRTILIVLFAINFLNYLDRQVIFPLFSNIKAEFHVSDFQLGLLGTVFMLVHSLSSVPFGIWADKYSRKTAIAAGVGIWSIATVASGFATSFKMLLGIRSVVGIGEAAYAPAATAMISESFPEKNRSYVQGIFNIGMFLGGTIGAMTGGLIAYYFHTWRLAFFLVGIPGLVLAFLAGKLVSKEAKPDAHLPGAMTLFRNSSFFWIITGSVLVTFAGGGFVAWGVEFIRRYEGYNLRDAALGLGLVFMLAGVAGVMLGSRVADWLHERTPAGYPLLVGGSLLVAAPLIFLGLTLSHGFFLLFFFGTMLVSFYHGPITALIHEVVPQHLWATAFALYLLISHLLGDTLAPAVIGRFSDEYSLRLGLQWSTLLVFLGGLAFLVVAFQKRRRRTV